MMEFDKIYTDGKVIVIDTTDTNEAGRQILSSLIYYGALKEEPYITIYNPTDITNEDYTNDLYVLAEMLRDFLRDKGVLEKKYRPLREEVYATLERYIDVHNLRVDFAGVNGVFKRTGALDLSKVLEEEQSAPEEPKTPKKKKK